MPMHTLCILDKVRYRNERESGVALKSFNINETFCYYRNANKIMAYFYNIIIVQMKNSLESHGIGVFF